MTESAPMSLAQAVAVNRAAVGTATDLPSGRIVVALWPYGTAHGGTMMTAALSLDAARSLRDQLSAAIFSAS
jgi:hypothetical protein